MADPIVEKIRQNLLTVLAGVTVANGYTGTLTVQSVARHGNDAGDLLAILEQSDESLIGEEGSVLHDTFMQQFKVFINILNPNGATDFDRRCNLAAADVRKAVMVDVARGGLALRTELVAVDIFVNEAGEIAGVVVPFGVLYRTKLDDPFTQA